jgi:radical SAM protein with 4Fe4S-binding SPASM domain
LREDAYALQRGRAPLLSTLQIELTERCNNDCIHCYINRPAHDRSAKQKEMTTGQVEELLREAAALGALTVTLTGGEPLLRDDFEALYLFARTQGLRVRLLTNATLVTPRLARLFSRVPPLEKVQITLYGMRAASYEAVTRTSGSFERAWSGIQLLIHENVPLIVKGARLEPNQAERDQFEAWADTLPWADRPPPTTVLYHLRARRDSEAKNQRIRRLRPSPGEVVAHLARNRDEYLADARRLLAQSTRPAGDRLFACGAGVSTGCVDAYGVFQPCMLLRHPEATYDLAAGSLHDALTRFVPRLRERKAHHPDYLARCARCFLKGLCEQCPARSWMEHGTLDTPVKDCCQVAHAQARYLGLLEEGEHAWEAQDGERRVAAFAGRGSGS